MLHKAKIQTAIERIEMFEPEAGYYGAFSGGKDSVVLYDLTERAGVKVDWHFNKTTVDPVQVIRFIRKYYTEVAIERPETTMWKLIERKGIPPTRRIRYCCEYLKERGGADRRVLMGIRWEESTQRKNRRMVETCYKHSMKTFVNPIIDWTLREIWEYTYAQDLPICELYALQKRIGCVMCPMAGIKQRKAEGKRYPGFYKAYLRAFDKMLKERERRGKKTTWKTPEEVMAWWLSA